MCNFKRWSTLAISICITVDLKVEAIKYSMASIHNFISKFSIVETFYSLFEVINRTKFCKIDVKIILNLKLVPMF